MQPQFEDGESPQNIKAQFAIIAGDGDVVDVSDGICGDGIGEAGAMGGGGGWVADSKLGYAPTPTAAYMYTQFEDCDAPRLL